MTKQTLSLEEYLFVGSRRNLGEIHFSKEAIIEFASKFDPQPFHLDEELAQDSFLGGLCASGWHTAANWMKAFRAHSEAQEAEWNEQGVNLPIMGPSPGFENLRWLKPVYAGDTVRYFTTVKTMRASASMQGWYVASCLNEGVNQNDDLVIDFHSAFFIALPADVTI